MNLYSYLSFAAFLVYLYLGFYVIKAGKKSKLNILFFILCMSFAIWSFSYMFVYSAKDIYTARVWNKISALGWCTYSGFLMHITLIVTKKERILNKGWIYIVLYLPSIILLYIRFFILRSGASNQEIIYNMFTIIETVYNFCYPMLCLIHIWYWGKRTLIKREKMQAKIIVISGVSALAIGNIVQNLLPVLGIKTIPLIAQITTIIFILGIWYSIVKYGFMDLMKLISPDMIINNVNDIVIFVDHESRIKNINRRLEDLLGYTSDELTGKPVKTLIDGCHDFKLTEIENKCCFDDNYEVWLNCKDGTKLPVKIHLSMVYNRADEAAGVAIIGSDITNMKKLTCEVENRTQKEKELLFINFHDPLTKLFNRCYFEQQIKRFEEENCSPLGIMVCDIDGLKLVNDVFGHESGDRMIVTAAEILKSVFDENAVVSRIDGDEFAVILPYCNKDAINRAVDSLKEMILKYNDNNESLYLSMSYGISFREDTSKTIIDLFRDASDKMYSEKLNRSLSSKNSLVQTLTKILEERDFITEGHAERLQDVVVEIGIKIGMTESQITNLRLLAQFHDIGKVGIPDKILFKETKLDEDEMIQMQQHSEIGCRIAQASPELFPISSLIMKHHEKWNGKGYPMGIKEEEIPVECRILAIADAFDAMTNDRPYRKAMPKEKAFEELKKCAGTQFDPSLVTIFIKLFDCTEKEGLIEI